MNITVNHPKVSIITVVLNAEKTLENTINSVINQTYKNTEFIVIDGKSTDHTLEIINKYNSYITQWISEPDQGLYDAMNKGIKLASGDYVWFINAGDEIYAPDTLEKIFSENRLYDIYYGETMLIDSEGKEIGLRSNETSQKLPKQLNWRRMKWGMVVSHQSVITKKNIAPYFNIEYKCSADIDWLIRVLKKTPFVKNTRIIVSKFMANRVLGKFHAGGESKSQLYRSLNERHHIFIEHFGFIQAIYNQILIFLKAFLFVIRKNF